MVLASNKVANIGQQGNGYSCLLVLDFIREIIARKHQQ